MRPLLVESSCLVCHTGVGERVGGIRGGVAVSVPLTPFWATRRGEMLSPAVGGGLLWLCGLAVLGFDAWRLQQADEQLAAARRQASESSRLKSEFLATMNHEIRTPMNGVLGMTSLLADTPLNAAQAEYVRIIESSGEALLNLFRDILDCAKIEAGQVEIEATPFDLRQCLEDTLGLFASGAAEKKLELVYVLAPGVPDQVAGDAARLRQILVSLLGNAVKFTSTGEVVLTVAAEPAGDRLRLRFTIRDTGIGIPAEGMSRLFHSFSQAHASTTRRFGGTGLGLATSRRLAELMGGTMGAESTPGTGSTFHFTIVVRACPPLTPSDCLARQPEMAGRRLLLVDDNETSRLLAAGWAEAWGLEVRPVDNAAAAVALLQNDPGCDLAVLDLQMPGMGGVELARAIHQLPGCTSLPLLLLTPGAWRSTCPEFTQSVMKPLAPARLLAAIRACPRTVPALRPAGPTPPPRATAIGERHPLRLLVAEDNVVNQKVVNLMLQRLGYRATTVADGLAVLAALEAAEYDVILMDLEMPELDGCEATRRLRAAPGASPVRPWIIALTASAMPYDRERTTASGMNDFLAKPVRSDTLAQALIRAHGTLAAATPLRSDRAASSV